MCATTSRGVRLGTAMPTQKSKSDSGKPASSMVGTFGSAVARLALLTASDQLTLLNERERRGQRREIHVHTSGQHLGQRLRRPLERNQLSLEAGGKAKALHGEVRRRADAGGG